MKIIYKIEINKNLFTHGFTIKLEQLEIVKETPKQYHVNGEYSIKRLSKETLERHGYEKESYGGIYYSLDKKTLVEKFKEVLKTRLNRAKESLGHAEELMSEFNRFVKEEVK